MGMGKKVGSGGGYYQDGGLFQDRLAAGFVSVRGLTQVSMGTMSVRSKSRRYLHMTYQVPAQSQCHHSKFYLIYDHNSTIKYTLL